MGIKKYSLTSVLVNSKTLGFSIIRNRSMRNGMVTNTRLGAFQHPSLGNLPTLTDIDEQYVLVDESEKKLIDLIETVV